MIPTEEASREEAGNEASEDGRGAERQKSEPADDGRKSDWREVWREFSQTTTVHGVIKTTDTDASVGRRMVWTLMVLTGFVLFIYQLGLSCAQYLSYPINVNVKINYNDTITFPAVTICNENSFRLTAASEEGHYTLINQYYTNLEDGGVDLHKLGAANTTLNELYEASAHQINDMLVSCMWSTAEKCSSKDFQLKITDRGYCFTFNSRDRPGGPLNVSTTGVARGLQLTLNIEQYEYMAGPTEGAGIKILLHNHKEEPLVQDFAQAVPPGALAFIGVQAIGANSMPHPHGICNDSVSLKYYELYSESACKTECKMLYMVSSCGCREPYMPSDMEGYPPICDLDTYQTCYQNALVTYRPEECSCPVPCKSLTYAGSVSYASISNLDVERYLLDNNTAALQRKLVAARETRDREEDRTVVADVELIEEYEHEVEHMVESVQEVLESVTQVTRSTVDDIMDDLTMRSTFHYDAGLDRLHYTTVNEFRRGYQLKEERTFTSVTLGYNELPPYLEYSLSEITNTSIDEDLRYNLMGLCMAKLTMRKSAAIRALDHMGDVEISFSRPKSLAFYTVTPYRYYDSSLITEDIISTPLSRAMFGPDVAEFYQYVHGYLADIETLEEIVTSAFRNSSYNASLFNLTTDRSSGGFLHKAEKIIDIVYTIRERHVELSVQITQAKIDAFDAAQVEIDLHLLDTRAFIADVSTSVAQAEASLAYFTHIGELALEYLNGTLSKTYLADYSLSEQTKEKLQKLEKLIFIITNGFVVVKQKVSQLQDAVIAKWRLILEEHALDEFYRQIRRDVIKFNNDTEAEDGDIKKVFRDLLNVDDDFLEANKTDLYMIMNADFPTIDIDEKLNELNRRFTELKDVYQVAADMQGADHFYHTIEEWTEAMTSFKQKCQIDSTFYKENYIQIGLYIGSLNYEEIEQQEAYSIVSLWGNIGGSVGLFIGASTLTIFEFFDVILLNAAKLWTSKKRVSAWK